MLGRSFLSLVACLIAIAPGSVDAGWISRCDDQVCGIIATQVVRFGDMRILCVAEFRKDGEFVFTALESLSDHFIMFTTRPATFFRTKGTEYVPVRYFNYNFDAKLFVDNVLVTSASPNLRLQYVVIAPKLISTIAKGRRLTVEYVDSFAGVHKMSFDLAGFGQQFAVAPSLPQPVISFQEPTSAVSALLPPFERERSRYLVSVKNPHGEGDFVFDRREKRILWFVNRNQVVWVNGPTQQVSPGALDSREIGLRFWRGTGVTPDTLIDIAFSAAGVP